MISELQLSLLKVSDRDLFISPYPKIPIIPPPCKRINTVHDVLDISCKPYRNRPKAAYAKIRLGTALRFSDLTWYVSEWSKKETQVMMGFTGKKPSVRFNGIEEVFTPEQKNDDEAVLLRHHLSPGYILTIGNGKPHKNLGVLLKAASFSERQFVFLGVQDRWQNFWMRKQAAKNVSWISFIPDDELPAIIRNAFCLAQPSIIEGFGYPPLEAMACGTPTIVSDLPVLRETTGNASLYANPHAPGQWLDRLKLLEGKEIRLRLEKEGLAWVNGFKKDRGWRGHLSDIESLFA